MVQPFILSYLDPWQIVRGEQGMQSLSNFLLITWNTPGPAAQEHNREGIFLGYGACTWVRNRAPSWRPRLPIGGEQGDMPLFLPSPKASAATLIKAAEWLWWWDVWLMAGNGTWVPPEQHCTSSCLVLSADLIALCCFSCPCLNPHYHY